MSAIDDVARALNQAGIDASIAGKIAATLVLDSTNNALVIAAPFTAGVITPANAAYTQADQSALATAVLALAATVNSIRATLTTAGITA